MLALWTALQQQQVTVTVSSNMRTHFLMGENREDH